MNCIFCKIISGDIESEKVYEDDNVIAFNDINPLASIHILVVPKIHFKSINEIEDEKISIMNNLFTAVKHITEDMVELSRNGYRTIINSGPNSGQEVDHLHIHILGGEKLGPLN